MSPKPTLQDLRSRHDVLQKELSGLQVQHESMHARFMQQYHLSIEDSMQSLFEVIAYVRKADKTLVEWHHRSDKLKRALRLVGVDRRTSTVITKKTTKLKARISVVEGKFGETNDTVALGLSETENMKKEFTHFSQTALDPMARQTIEVQEDLDSTHGTIQTQISKQHILRSQAENRVKEASDTLSRTKSERDSAVAAQARMGAGSLLGFGLAGAAAVLFPPSLLVTGATMAVGAGAGTLASMAIGANEGIKELEKEQERLTALLKPHEDAIRALKIELSGLDLRRDELAAALRSVEALHKQTSILRTSVQDNIDFARQTKLALERTRLKLADIVQTLQDCQYEETRRSIAIRLREVLATIQAGSAKKAIEPEQLRKATQYLTDIDNKTVEVVRVLTIAPKQLQA